MNWFFMSLSCAFFTACCDAASKRIMQENDEWITGTIILGISSLVILPVFFASDLKPITWELICVLGVLLPLEIFAYYLFLSSIRMAALSLTVPLLAFTPVLTILTSWILLGERITFTGGFGIFLVTLGAYILNANLININILEPLKAIFSNAGSRRMLFVAFIWSFTSALGKKGVLIYDPIPFGCLVLFGDVFFFALISILRIQNGLAETKISRGTLLLFLLAGALMAGAELTHVIALSLAPVSYMISVKRLSLVFGVILGWLFFNEKNIHYRLIGASTMVVGIFFIYN